MGYSFNDLGIGRRDVLEAIDALRFGLIEPTGRSRNAYIVDPRDEWLCDLKQVLQALEHITDRTLLPGYTTHRYRTDLKRAGFSLLVFEEQAQRALGVAGFDPVELEAAHMLHRSNGTTFRNWFGTARTPDRQDGPEVASDLRFYESRVARWHLAFERLGQNARLVKQSQGLTCAGCGLDGEAAFGRDLAMSAMEAHHLVPVADMPEGGREVSTDDFAVLCATCHRLIHRLQSPDDLVGLRKLMRGKGPGKGLPWLR
ncbi:HNH endonuclease [Pseudooceanicola antarcticus]|nr:HNH endonuclease [Pseudooceanicola antarcticus]SNY46466.1 HNH endonuclease [Pseudooceanicola antarcticus]